MVAVALAVAVSVPYCNRRVIFVKQAFYSSFLISSVTLREFWLLPRYLIDKMGVIFFTYSRALGFNFFSLPNPCILTLGMNGDIAVDNLHALFLFLPFSSLLGI